MRFFLPQVLLAVAMFPLPLGAQIRLAPLGGIKSSKADTGTKQDDSPCRAQAWVRAEDLSPNHISEGELRVKVSRADCAHQVVSVTLRLQLTEFSEFASLKDGVVLPEQQTVNETTPLDNVAHEVVYDYLPYVEATSDPNLWNFQAQERVAWMTEATLLDSLPDLTHPIVTPFTVSIPAVNYPPGDERTRVVRNGRHGWGDLSYEYTAIVTFTDGRTVDVPAGHTTFVPVDHVDRTKMPFSWNATFKDPCAQRQDRELDRCLPKDERSEFVAAVTLDEGNVVEKGNLLKGRVTVHSTRGSTTVSGISAGVWTGYRDHWAQALATAAGDADFVGATSFSQQRCRTALGGRPLNADSPSYAQIFAEPSESPRWRFPPVMLVSSDDSQKNTFTPEQPHFDFEFQVQNHHPVNFASYYSSAENQLLLNLDVVYAPEVADCLKKPQPRPQTTAADEAAAVEERLWDSSTRVAHPADFTERKPPKSKRCMMSLVATVPLTLVGSAIPTDDPVAHYLTPGLPAPVIRSGLGIEVVEFPLASPVAHDEPVGDTISRLLEPHHQSSRYQGFRRWEDIPDPSKGYRRRDYAGLLWKKKAVAEERGILKQLQILKLLQPEAAEPEREAQQPWSN
ncbi:hypothetical protein B0H16DRAFT_1580230 [Mycena metata]|uniref:Uncharacterized protein n=1 Tax=Mycena metata TaxID=1033252 RepID=A0AAD7I2H7_9AGAR|nr:hypothetical protein B0H16DRAFT_1580230 [Mycena metata]